MPTFKLVSFFLEINVIRYVNTIYRMCKNLTVSRLNVWLSTTELYIAQCSLPTFCCYSSLNIEFQFWKETWQLAYTDDNMILTHSIRAKQHTKK
jgi:hypothetical protein